MKRNLAKLTTLVFLVVSILNVIAFGALAEDGDKSVWTVSKKMNGYVKAVDGGVQVSSGEAYYNVEKFLNVTVKFDAILPINYGWPAFLLRNNNVDAPCWSTKAYFFSVKKQEGTQDAIEVAKFGAENGYKEVHPRTYPVAEGELHSYEVSSINETKGVRLILKIDGEEIYNYLDEKTPITTEGYFSVAAYDSAGKSCPIIIKNLTFEKAAIDVEVEVESDPNENDTSGLTNPGDTSVWSKMITQNNPATYITPVEDGGVKISGVAYYNVDTHQDATYKFKATSLTGKGWPGFAVRVSNSEYNVAERDAWGMDAYIFDSSAVNGFEFQHFHADESEQEDYYISDRKFIAGQEYDIEITTKNEGDGVRWIVKVDGEEVHNELDTDRPVLIDGYFTVNAYKSDDGVENPVIIRDFTVNAGEIVDVVIPEDEYTSDLGASIDTTNDVSIWSEIITANNPATTIKAVDGGVQISGAAYLNTGKYKNAKYKFKFSATSPSDMGWPGLAARVINSNFSVNERDVWGNDAYMFGVHWTNGIEFQQFHADESQTEIDRMDNTIFEEGKEYEVEITTINEGSGVRWIVLVDGVEIYNILDEDRQATKAGYFLVNAYKSNDGSENPVIIKDFSVEVLDVEETPDIVDTETPEEDDVENPETGIVVVPYALIALIGAAGTVFTRRQVK